MIVSLIVALDEKGGIGLEQRLPWRLSADLKRFKSLTMGHHLIMGRKTYETIGKPLPGRTTIIITRNPHYSAPGCSEVQCLIAQSLKQALKLASDCGDDEVFIIGGGQIFNQSLQLADRIYLTQVHAEVDADTFFPLLDQNQWSEVKSSYHPADELNQYPTTFKILSRKHT
ncbi:MAG: dihydrofolate reductase [Anaerolineales bacterium]|nr:dihydrofolate reductase [Anaerolineales bacterium]